MYEFNYAIQRPDGKKYTGTAHDHWNDNWSDHPQKIYTYTEEGAHRKIASNSSFKNCVVVRV